MENEIIGRDENFYEKVKLIFNCPDNKLKGEFKRVIGWTNEKGYIIYATVWLNLALNSDELKLAERLFGAFFEDIEKFYPWIVARTAMRLEGIDDIEYLDTWGDSPDKPQRGPISFSSLKMTSEIYSRSKYDTPLLIVGETGTSKEFLAKAVHRMSDRRKGPFEEINCAAIPKDLLEGELFGYKQGSFTGAVKSKDGILKVGDNGTIFLDEIGKMPDYLQAKLLKVVEEKKFRSLGSEKESIINVRFIAAAQPKDTKTIIPDLFWRLGGPDWIQMPTINERLSHFPLSYVMIIDNSKKRVLKKMGLEGNIGISESAYDKLRAHEYIGNYRELETILTAAIRKARLQKRDKILSEDLEETMSKSKKYFEPEGEDDPRDIKLKDIIEYAQKKKVSIIEAKLEEILRSGKHVKAVLREEGLSEKDYPNFRKKIVTVTGKKLKEFDL